jgi:hypothetical protein
MDNAAADHSTSAASPTTWPLMGCCAFLLPYCSEKGDRDRTYSATEKRGAIVSRVHSVTL